MSEEELNRILSRLEELVRSFPPAKLRKPRPPVGRDDPGDWVQPSFWWGEAFAPQPEFHRRSEDLCRQIVFSATSIHRLAAFARVRYRVQAQSAGVMLAVQILDCPLAGTHCDGESCLLCVDGKYAAVRWLERTDHHETTLN